jgi:glycosyltransferase involved in cell wall biosynthesis
MRPKYSVVIPVYKNENTVGELFDTLEMISVELGEPVQVVFVDDGSPDNAKIHILQRAQKTNLEVRLISHTRNFGSFPAIRTGLQNATGDFIGVVSADLQEPPALLISFFKKLEDESLDIVFGSRASRSDPLINQSLSKVYWTLYRLVLNREIPNNGVDIFACRREVANVVNGLKENNTSLIGLLFWVGFKKGFQEYDRLPRREGKSSWTFKNKFKYMADSVFSFSDLPIRIIRFLGFFGTLLSLSIGFFLLFASLRGNIEVPGYAPIMLAILFSNSAVLVALGILGSYLWRTFQNTQMRPSSISYETKGERPHEIL